MFNIDKILASEAGEEAKLLWVGGQKSTPGVEGSRGGWNGVQMLGSIGAIAGFDRFLCGVTRVRVGSSSCVGRY